MKRAAAAAVLTGAAWMGLSGEARAQVLIMPTGPLSLKAFRDVLPAVKIGQDSNDDSFYPGRTMGGGARIPRSVPPPSFFKRRKE